MLVPYENERGMDATRELIGKLTPGQSVGILIGPEGGFSGAEIAETDSLGFFRISLGRRILRTETAGLATLAMLVFQLDE
jgi:16S rRNA (uracil1498-N3)-methyltransferase